MIDGWSGGRWFTDLLAGLDAVPLAREMLFGAALYESPVDDIGLARQVSPHVEPPPDPDRDERMKQACALLTRAQQEGISVEQAGLTAEHAEQWSRDWAERRRPPLDVPAVLGPARDALLGARQRRELGDDAFRATRTEHLDPESIETLLHAVDQVQLDDA